MTTTRVYIAIDDTDTIETDTAASRGTGAVARDLAALLDRRGLGRSLGVTRHQLLVDPRIPYTSHNSAACLLIETNGAPVEELAVAAAAFLSAEAAPGSDAGLCVAPEARVGPTITDFGRRAKREVLTAAAAHRLAEEAGLHLSGHTGERIGVIGALAAVGLRQSGNDGRFLDLNGLRALHGVQPVATLHGTGIRRFRSMTSPVTLRPTDTIDVGEKWPQPILEHGEPTLILERVALPKMAVPEVAVPWRVAPRELMKQF